MHPSHNDGQLLSTSAQPGVFICTFHQVAYVLTVIP